MKKLDIANLKTAAKSGFTVIEFSIATTFIAVLLIAIAIITSSIITTYQKGLALKAVNSVGRGLVDELTSAINNAPPVDTTSLCGSYLTSNQDTCKDEGAYKFVFQEKIGENINSEKGDGQQDATGQVQYAGIFCTGGYSYIWNTYYGQGDKGLKLRYNGGEILENFRLARFSDPTYRACSVSVNKTEYEYYLPSDNIINITTLDNGSNNTIDTPTQGFLESFDLDLILYELTIFPIAQNTVTLRTFMPGTFILATQRGNINIVRSGNYCDIKDTDSGDDASSISNLGAEFNYCAINKFNFAARTSGL